MFFFGQKSVDLFFSIIYVYSTPFHNIFQYIHNFWWKHFWQLPSKKSSTTINILDWIRFDFWGFASEAIFERFIIKVGVSEHWFKWGIFPPDLAQMYTFAPIETIFASFKDFLIIFCANESWDRARKNPKVFYPLTSFLPHFFSLEVYSYFMFKTHIYPHFDV